MSAIFAQNPAVVLYDNGCAGFIPISKHRRFSAYHLAAHTDADAAVLLYRTQLIPGYWHNIIASSDPTWYMIYHDVAPPAPEARVPSHSRRCIGSAVPRSNIGGMNTKFLKPPKGLKSVFKSPKVQINGLALALANPFG
ncbi:hypothetical protein GGX14DRAFT_403668 [Mycena pura]|uniref:Uncharacterized protein n=1 Tax=Mycena pura TaxID=153505 RepID=A0AAD6UZF4_9AGAR|nr:hypothetical protein GGX14DRAFT_403668 [Mycena pura]